MSDKTIKSALGLLQDDPDNDKAWSDLQGELADPGMSPAELAKLLEAARTAHEGRRELAAVARLLDLEADGAQGPRKGALLTELARMYDEELLDYPAARKADERIGGAGGATATEGAPSR